MNAGKFIADLNCSAETPLPAGDETVIIGVQNPEGDPAGSFPEYSLAIQAAADYINAELGGLGGDPVNGVAGKKIQLIILDDSAEPSKAATNAKRLLPEWLVKRWLDEAEPRRLLLTFDDGPSPEVTLQVLERLERYGARAVFFVVGRRVEEAPEVVDAILRAGHLIGNHTYHHDNIGEPALPEYVAELRQCQDVVAKYGPAPWLFRPPRGRLSFASLVASRVVARRQYKPPTLLSEEVVDFGIGQDGLGGHARGLSSMRLRSSGRRGRSTGAG